MEHIRYNYREGGVAQIVRKLFYRARTALWSEELHHVYRAETVGYSLPPRLPLVERIADLEELRRVKYFKLETFGHAIVARLGKGSICRAFYLEGSFVNLIWETPFRLELSENVEFLLPETMGLLDGFTVPEFRRRGINSDTHIRLVHIAARSGYRYVVGAIHPDNAHSIRSYVKAGYYHYADAIVRRRFLTRSQELRLVRPSLEA